MSEEKRRILEMVANGELAPDEAARLLAELDELLRNTEPFDAGPRNGTSADHDTDSATRELPPPTERATYPGAGARRLQVNATAARVILTGDPTVAGAEADGPHSMNDDGEMLSINCEPLGGFHRQVDDDDGFVMTSHRRRHRAHLRFGWSGEPGWGSVGERTVRIRANPDLALEAAVVAGSLRVDGMRGPISCDVSGGKASLHDVRGPFTASVSAGALSVSGRLREGESRVSCDMGSVAVRLEPGSSVRVRSSVNLGKAAVRLPREGDEWVVGGGDALLVLSGNMASVAVSEDG
jgi:hypothetical protein